MTTKRKVLNKKLQKFRRKLRTNKTSITNHILKGCDGSHCVFCFSKNKISKEHILPRWMFASDQKDYFTSTFNGADLTYERSVLPVCSECNNETLSSLEKYIIEELSSTYDPEDLDIIFLWLEIISYKFHVFDFKTKFLKNFETNEQIPYLRNFTIGELNSDYPGKGLRMSISRLTVKNKKDRINSFLFFKTKNKGKHFFHKTNEFIFIESPRLNCAIFYFLVEEFETEKDAHTAGMKIIKNVY